MSALINYLNTAFYIYRRNNWMIDPRLYIANFKAVKINKPIFLLGVQGGGLTLISRMLRRNKDMVSVSGNYKYWAGADEMQNVLEPILPPSLSGLHRHVPPDDLFRKTRTWVYATDRLLPKYRKTEQDATLADAAAFQKIIKWTIHRNALDPRSARFTDKSQLYTIKVAYINELLKGCDPYFILITRNPYAVCLSRTKDHASLKELAPQYDFAQRLNFAAQHWANSMGCALTDAPKVAHFMTIRFEDVLCEPEKSLRQICQFADVAFDMDMLPQASHHLPFGSQRQERWYPIRPAVNSKHFDNLQQEYIEIIDQHCRPYATKLGYEKPSRS